MTLSIHATPPPIPLSTLLTRLKSLPTPLLPPVRPQIASLSDTIASQYLHPALEALLHLFNHDLPSAHFLVRHMQSPPAYEGMYVHGILHRIEGDWDNARAWYADVGSWEGFVRFWGEGEGGGGLEGGGGDGEGKKMPRQKGARDFLDDLERWARKGGGRGGRGTEGQGRAELEELREKSRGELESLLEWCLEKFGTEMHEDDTKAWVRPSQEISKMGEDQVSGQGGPRKF